MCTDLGAANHYSIEHLKSSKIWAHAEAAELFYVGGYHLTVSPEAALALGAEAAKRNVPFVFGMGAPFIAYAFKEPLDKVWEYTDYTFGNETEATAWAEVHGLETKTTSASDIKAIAKAMALYSKKNEKRARTCVITQGTEPTIVAVADGKGGVEIKEFPVHAIAKSEIVDTTGAGDAFAGGFLAGLVEGKKLDVCVDMGMWLAAKGLAELGPRYVKRSRFIFGCESCGATKRRDIRHAVEHEARTKRQKRQPSSPNIVLPTLLAKRDKHTSPIILLTIRLLATPSPSNPTNQLPPPPKHRPPCSSTHIDLNSHPQTKRIFAFPGVSAT